MTSAFWLLYVNTDNCQSSWIFLNIYPRVELPFCIVIIYLSLEGQPNRFLQWLQCTQAPPPGTQEVPISIRPCRYPHGCKWYLTEVFSLLVQIGFRYLSLDALGFPVSRESGEVEGTRAERTGRMCVPHSSSGLVMHPGNRLSFQSKSTVLVRASGVG